MTALSLQLIESQNFKRRSQSTRKVNNNYIQRNEWILSYCLLFCIGLTKTMSSSDASKLRVAIELGYSQLMTEKVKHLFLCAVEMHHSSRRI